MTNPPRPQDVPRSDSAPTLRDRWLSPKRKRFWAILAVVVYTLAGFFAVPPLVKSLTIDALRDATGREARIERVRFNPYVLSLEVNGFELEDSDGVRLAGFDRLFVNFQLSSLFRWAWTLREFSVDGLYALLERYAPGDSRLTRLLADVEARAEPGAEEADEGGLPRLLVQELNLNDGGFEFRDHVPQDPVDLVFGPVTVSVQELNTLPDRYGQQSVQVVLPNDAVVSWQGSISLGPLESEGSFSLTGSHLEQTTTYLKSVLPLESLQLTLSTRTRYRVEEQPDGSIDVELDDLQADISDFSVTGLAPAAEFLSFSSLSLAGGAVRIPENTLEFATVRLEGPALDAWLDESGEASLLQLVPPGDAGTPENAAAAGTGRDEASSPWRVRIEEFQLADGSVAFQDRSIDPPGAARLQDLDLSLANVSNEEQARMPLSVSGNLAEGGRLAFDGELALLPELEASGRAELGGIALALAQPYARQSANVRIEGGTLDTSAELTLRPDQTLALAGSLAIDGLAVHDTVEGRPLVGWQRLETDRYEVDTATSGVKLSRLVFTQPFGRLVINPDQTTNLTGLAVEPPAAPDAAAGDAAAAPERATGPGTDPGEAAAADYSIVIGGIEVREGALDFSDLSLPLPFATEIRDLGGTISTIATASTEPANVALEGQVDEFGLARISGDLNLLDPLRKTDISMEFRNLLMSNLSPYTVQFAGREIDQGKLDLDLQYVIDNGLMQGQNDIVMSDLVLGDKVDSPGAASLPLGLAVALLKDSNGVIDIELPVEGDVNDPQFRIGGVIWQAFVGLVTKIVSAPFRLLGGLVGADSEDLGQFQFLAGRADLAPPELESVALLQEALQKRPELSIEVSGAYVPAVDTPALKRQRLREDVLGRMEQAAQAQGEEVRLLDEAVRSTLEAVFTERFPQTPLDTVKAAHTSPPTEEPEGEPVFDELAYAADLRDRLLDAIEITQADLERLADARATAIRDAFLAGGAFDESRITVAAPQETESEDDEWVLMELGVAAE